MADQTVESIFSLAGQVAIITGGSRGIGRGIAETFGVAGARLAIVARNPERLAETADQLRSEGYDVLDCPADITVEAHVNAIVQRVVEQFGRVDILVNNAGILQAGPIGTFTAADWERMIATNLTSVFYFCRAVAPLLSAQRSGRIINIASITAQTGGVSGGVHYSASKGGLLALTKTLARDLAPFNVTVNAICPGQIETEILPLDPEARKRLEGMIPLGRIGQPMDIAHAALFLASAAASYITGAAIDVNGGLLKR